ncbi:MAG TPA: hypothetical protein VFE02_12305 [Candidatus Acidoferrales bacterium]|jgi:hypothetical protein|nr:hypothetical protein [Candidatus Acidoferrales bacterium]
MPDDSVRDLVRHVRAQLQRKGSLGGFLLSELDNSIAQGVEEILTDSDLFGSKAGQVIGRRIPNDLELLAVLVNVLEAYLVVLPATIRTLTAYLHDHYRIESVEMTLDPSLLSAAVEETGRAQIDAFLPVIKEEKAIRALKKLHAFAEQVRGRNKE